MDKPRGSLASPYWSSPSNWIQCGNVTFHVSLELGEIESSGNRRLTRLVVGAFFEFKWTRGREPTRKELLELLKANGTPMSARTFRRVLAKTRFFGLKKAKSGRKPLQ